MIISKIVEELHPSARSRYLEALEKSESLIQDTYQINTPLRIAHFLAQIGHESGSFRYLRESMNYSAKRIMEVFGKGKHSAGITLGEAKKLERSPRDLAERVYGIGNPILSRVLGNMNPGDGWVYRGNGLLQITGKLNHYLAGEEFLDYPGLMTAPDHALLPPLRFWDRHNLNLYADLNDVRTITRKINGGYNGLPDRERRLKQALAFMLPEYTKEVWRLGASDMEVAKIQRDLNLLGASPVLEEDGRYGPKTRIAVKRFQNAVGIKDDGVAGPVTLSAIKLWMDRLHQGCR